MNFGPQTSSEDSFRILDRALDHGINFVDTADVYGRKKGEGVTERILGDWFAQGGGRREKVVLATKVYGEMNEWPNMGKLSALHIRRACEASLTRLKTDHLDLYQMHHIWRDAAWDEVWQAMELLVQQGKVLYVGSSNFAGWQIAQGCETARARHFLGLVSEQSLYNLNARTVELEVLPACQAYGLGVLPWSPLAGGLLGGAFGKAAQGRRAEDSAQRHIEKHRARLEPWEKFCRDLGEEPANIALAWVLSNKAVTAPVVGPRTVSQLDGCLRALDIEITREISNRLDQIFPGPGGPAPEAYAW
jgi:aryl-alcohol dehydrogenase-like predicted oxidoreductase